MKTSVAAIACAVAGVVFAIGYNAYLFGWVGEPESTLLANLPEPQEVEPILDKDPRPRRGNPRTNASAMLPLPPADGPQPKAVAVEPSFDFGSMMGGDKGRHEFVIRNDGEYPLQLAKGKTSCKCTISDLPVTKLEPGEETKILVTWKTTSSRPGKFRQTARVLTNDPKQQTLTFTVAGDITVLLRSVPSYVSFGRMTPRESKTVEFKLHSYHLVITRLEVESFEFEHPETAEFFDVSFQPLANDKLDQNSTSGLVGKLTFKGDREGLPPFPAGPIRQTLRIKTNVREVDTIPLTLGGSVVREIDISCRGWNSVKRQLDLHLLNDQAKEKLPLHVWVRGTEWEDVEVEVESVSPDWLKVSKANTESRAASKTKHVVFNIHVDKDAEAKYLENAEASRVGKIVLKTTHSEMKQVDIPVQLALEPEPESTSDPSPPTKEAATVEKKPKTADNE